MRPGDVLDEAFVLDELSARGAFGEVWTARRLADQLPVLVKRLRASAARRREVRERFKREAKVAALVGEPWTCPPLAARVEPPGPLFIVFERLAGESMEARLAREGSLALSDLYPIMEGVLAALARAHELSIVHRDVKPANVFLAADAVQGPCARLLDFGAVKLTASSQDGAALTSSGHTVGTLAYMPPEQYRSSTASTASDVYAAGVLAFVALAGRLPFRAPSTAALLSLKSHHEAPTISEVTNDRWPRVLEDWLSRMLRRDPKQRFVDARTALTAWQMIGERLRIAGVSG